MNQNNYKFGKFIRETRLKNKITQEELANLSFINIKTISKMENGKADIDLDKLEILSEILHVDLVETYLYTLLYDSEQINNIIKNLNSRDRFSGSGQSEEIKILTEIESSSQRNFVKQKAKKLKLLFESIEIKEDLNKKKILITKALNIGKKFDFANLNSNNYDIIDYRLLLNYASYFKNPEERLKYHRFIENARIDNDNLNAILYHNMANTYYILYKSYIALYYINKSISSNRLNPISPIMLYQKSLILYDLSLDYKKYVKLTLKISKKTNANLYNLILEKYKKKANNDNNFIIP
ncbi:helix-turn-helix domain-containing protein [uncultured Anaerococcus sp.]|uniref:helix-turn-helix domain-containing protein n=1 Tax=uncultured Anaerococcus sp. TaxID=293428 RepID=UPI0025E5CA48|nr:helix-turn-helix transcriptional regulator [uncultured Anaerococcus sp.]